MLIREVAQRTGVSPDTIRYYESAGLLPRPQRASNRYRLYTEADVEQLRFIVGARALGYPLAEIAGFVAGGRDGSLHCQQVFASLDARLQEVEQRIAEMQAVRATLLHLREEAELRPQPCTCDEQCVCHLVTFVSLNKKDR
jgi:DNA-binding transcriptional MerR regulator